MVSTPAAARTPQSIPDALTVRVITKAFAILQACTPAGFVLFARDTH